MPRWPYGLHPVPVGVRMPGGDGARARRIPSPRQRYYWRHTPAELDLLLPLVVVNLAGQAATMAGPHGTGEYWNIHQVQVSTSSQLGQVPYVIQQSQGIPVPPPPPILAQVWLAVAGQQVQQLAQTTMAGQDAIGINWVPVEVGEQVAVIWYGARPGDNAQARLRGTRTVLDT